MNDARTSIAESVRAHIVATYAPELEASLGEETPLFQQGLLDSVHLLSFVLFVEETFFIEIRPRDITPDTFRNLRTIVALIERKRGSS